MLARLVALALVAVVCFGGRRYERDIAVFSFDQHPDLPLRSYAEGKLGIVQPSYARSYLYVAYRLIEGAGFNLIERNQVVDYWNWKLRGERPELDAYMWLTYRTFALKRPLRLSWKQVYQQFGAHPAKAIDKFVVRDFRTDFLRELKKIKTAWPDLHYATGRGVLILYPSAPVIAPSDRPLRLVQ